jgi:hypothetical protein
VASHAVYSIAQGQKERIPPLFQIIGSSLPKENVTSFSLLIISHISFFDMKLFLYIKLFLVLKERLPRRRRLKGARGRVTLEKEKLPILG